MVRASGELQLLRKRLLDDSAFKGLTKPSFIIPWLFWERIVCFLQSFMEKTAGLLAAERQHTQLFHKTINVVVLVAGYKQPGAEVAWLLNGQCHSVTQHSSKRS